MSAVAIHDFKHGHTFSADVTSSANVSLQTYVRSLHSSIYRNLEMKDMNVNISLGRNLHFPYLRNKQDITLKSVYFH